LESARRAINNILDPNIKTYYTLGEQMRVVGDFLSSNSDKIKRTKVDTTENIVKALQNEDGDITNKDIEFLDNVLNVRDSIDAYLLPTIIKLVKDEYGNLDPKKVMVFITKYAWLELSLSEIMEYMNKEYNSNSSEMSQEIKTKTKEVEDMIADEVKAAKAEERRKVYELVNRINSIVTNYGFQCFNAHINKSTGKIIVKCNRYDKGTVFDFHPGCYDMKDIVDDFTFSHIEEIDGDVCFMAENINIGCPLHVTGCVSGYRPNGFHNITAGRYDDFWPSKTNNTHQ
ncbi:hypothetical protein IJ596_05865, partial [bacterium]|nr:hypothetical protein [bacterium]